MDMKPNVSFCFEMLNGHLVDVHFEFSFRTDLVDEFLNWQKEKDRNLLPFRIQFHSNPKLEQKRTNDLVFSSFV